MCKILCTHQLTCWWNADSFTGSLCKSRFSNIMSFVPPNKVVHYLIACFYNTQRGS